MNIIKHLFILYAWFILLLSLTVNLTNASLHFYEKEVFIDVSNAFLLSGGSEGLAAPLSPNSDTPSVRNGQSSIQFYNVTFWKSKDAADLVEHGTGSIQGIIFEAADRDNIGGSAYGGQRAICCTPDLAKVEGCKQGEVLKRPSASNINWPVVLNVQFSGNYLHARMVDMEVPITKTGMYNLFFVTCDPNLKGLVMSGRTKWKNPHGYSPGWMFSLLRFYVFMSVAYLLLIVIWLSQYVRFWRDTLQLQHCITVVIALGLFEMVLWYFEYVNFNDTGIRPVVITTCVVTVGAVRKTVMRLLILSISMGYGVLRPTLGGLTSEVLLLGITYFLASELLDITEYVGTINDISVKARLFLVFPDAFVDAFLILWIFASLSTTLEQLEMKRSSVKFEIYRKFSNALVATVIASLAWILYEVYLKATDPFNERWESAWILSAFWNVLAFALLCVICYLWCPSPSSEWYAYSDEIGAQSDDEEAQSLNQAKPESELSFVKQELNEKDGGNTVKFDEDDDREEGKK